MDLICALQQPGSGHGAAEYLDLLNGVVVLERCDWLTGDIWNFLDLLNGVVVLERCDWLTGPTQRRRVRALRLVDCDLWQGFIVIST